jgi:iron complex transport system substrate-binding protein
MNKLLLIFLVGIIATPAFSDGPKRVVSIGGAITEIVYALDAASILVGSDTTSYYPGEAAKLPKVGYQRMLSAEGILSLRPDLVILTEKAGPPTVLAQLKSAGVKLVKIKTARSIENVKINILRIAEVFKRSKNAENLITSIEKNQVRLQRAIAKNPFVKRAMFILQHSGGTPMVAGEQTAANSIIMLSGAQNAVRGYRGYRPLTPEAAVALKPDVIILTTQGLKQSGGKEALLKIPGLALTPAAKRGKIVVMDSLMLLGFGPRTADAALKLNQAYQGL